MIKLLHLDDSMIAHKTLVKAFSAHPEIQWVWARSLEEFKQKIEGDDFRFVIVDINLGGESGIVALEWIKSHPRIHALPVVVLSSETQTEIFQSAFDRGALFCFEKPFHGPSLVEKVLRNLPADGALGQPELDQELGAELSEEISDLHKNLETGVEKQNLLQVMHRLKGNCLSLGWPILARMIHQIETTFQGHVGDVIQNLKLRSVLADSLDVLASYAHQLAEGKGHPVPPADYFAQLVKAQLLATEEQPKDKSNEANSARQGANRVEGTSKNETLRLERAKLDQLYLEFQKLMAIKVRLSQFHRSLKAEMEGEPFLRELAAMSNELNDVSLTMSDFFLKMRAKEFAQIAGPLKKMVDEACHHLGKEVVLDFQFEPGLLIDPRMLVLIENCLGHLLRNSIDHGIETPQLREAKDKPRAGVIQVGARTIGVKGKAQNVEIRVQDDGSGINLEKLKEKVASLGLFLPEQVARLSSSQVAEFVFLPQMSLKEEVNIYSGRGVGLNLVKDEIEKVGGSISLDTSPHGTEFRILLPLHFQLERAA